MPLRDDGDDDLDEGGDDAEQPERESLARAFVLALIAAAAAELAAGFVALVRAGVRWLKQRLDGPDEPTPPKPRKRKPSR